MIAIRNPKSQIHCDVTLGITNRYCNDRPDRTHRYRLALPPQLAPGLEEHGMVSARLHHRLLPVHRYPWPTLAIMNGLLTSIALETFILSRQMKMRTAIHTVIGMSFISMVAMESVMNAVDWGLTGGAVLTWWVVSNMLAAGFVTPLPYNYWRLKALGKACH